MKLETIAVHAADPDPATGGVAPPIQLSTTFARDGNLELVPGGAQYAREGGPTTSVTIPHRSRKSLAATPKP